MWRPGGKSRGGQTFYGRLCRRTSRRYVPLGGSSVHDGCPADRDGLYRPAPHQWLPCLAFVSAIASSGCAPYDCTLTRVPLAPSPRPSPVTRDQHLTIPSRYARS